MSRGRRRGASCVDSDYEADMVTERGRGDSPSRSPEVQMRLAKKPRAGRTTSEGTSEEDERRRRRLLANRRSAQRSRVKRLEEVGVLESVVDALMKEVEELRSELSAWTGQQQELLNEQAKLKERLRVEAGVQDIDALCIAHIEDEDEEEEAEAGKQAEQGCQQSPSVASQQQQQPQPQQQQQAEPMQIQQLAPPQQQPQRQQPSAATATSLPQQKHEHSQSPTLYCGTGAAQRPLLSQAQLPAVAAPLQPQPEASEELAMECISPGRLLDVCTTPLHDVDNHHDHHNHLEGQDQIAGLARPLGSAAGGAVGRGAAGVAVAVADCPGNGAGEAGDSYGGGSGVDRSGSATAYATAAVSRTSRALCQQSFPVAMKTDAGGGSGTSSGSPPLGHPVSSDPPRTPSASALYGNGDRGGSANQPADASLPYNAAEVSHGFFRQSPPQPPSPPQQQPQQQHCYPQMSPTQQRQQQQLMHQTADGAAQAGALVACALPPRMQPQPQPAQSSSTQPQRAAHAEYRSCGGGSGGGSGTGSGGGACAMAPYRAAAAAATAAATASHAGGAAPPLPPAPGVSGSQQHLMVQPGCGSSSGLARGAIPSGCDAFQLPPGPHHPHHHHLPSAAAVAAAGFHPAAAAASTASRGWDAMDAASPLSYGSRESPLLPAVTVTAAAAKYGCGCVTRRSSGGEGGTVPLPLHIPIGALMEPHVHLHHPHTAVLSTGTTSRPRAVGVQPPHHAHVSTAAPAAGIAAAAAAAATAAAATAARSSLAKGLPPPLPPTLLYSTRSGPAAVIAAGGGPAGAAQGGNDGGGNGGVNPLHMPYPAGPMERRTGDALSAGGAAAGSLAAVGAAALPLPAPTAAMLGHAPPYHADGIASHGPRHPRGTHPTGSEDSTSSYSGQRRRSVSSDSGRSLTYAQREGAQRQQPKQEAAGAAGDGTRLMHPHTLSPFSDPAAHGALLCYSATEGGPALEDWDLI